MKIAVAQIACVLGDVPSNIRTIERFTQNAHDAGAELVLFPEVSDTGYAMEAIRVNATDWKRGVVPAIREFARRWSLWIVCGVAERDGDSIHNSQVVVAPNGEIMARYRKAHLFAVEPIREDLCFAPGNQLASFDTTRFKFGLTICYDLRFPELFRRLAIDHRVLAFLLSSAWPCPRAPHLRSLAIARAIENQSYFIMANRVGTDNGVQFCGQSVIIDPSGAIMASASDDTEELIVADVSLDTVTSLRAQMPVFDHRREDLYA